MPRIGERGWIHSGERVYDNTNAPTSWTDLDLSAVVGKNHALVYLKVKHRGLTTPNDYAFRTDGHTDTVGVDGGCASGCTLARLSINRIAYILVETSAAGLLEWKSTYDIETDITVMGYAR